MKTYFHPDELKYDGTQLSSHFSYKNFDIKGDSLSAFIGECDVKTDKMVDLEDVQNKQLIYSQKMLHFIVEHFFDDLNLAISYQRLLITHIQAELLETQNGLVLQRRGDDLYDGIYKLTVSIATKSPVSCLIHTGINIISKDTPVATKGLEDYKVESQSFAQNVLQRYQNEIESMQWARAKVRGVL